MIAIIGLGNIGDKYANTKHNAGFWVIDELAVRYKLTFKPGKGNYLYADSQSKNFILVKPTTGMNKSGVAIIEIMKRWNILLSSIYVVVDDVDIPLGVLRIKPKGGDACHKGLENIIYQLRSKNFARVKFGIATNENMRPSEEYVLNPFKKDKLANVQQMVERCADSIQSIMVKGINNTMNKYNSIKKLEEINNGL